MKNIFRSALKIHETAMADLFTTIIRDPSHPYYGKPRLENGLYEPGSSLGNLERTVFLYLCPESVYYRKPEMLDMIRMLCIGGESGFHEDGTNDLIVSNYRQAEFFAAPAICMAYRGISAIPNKTPEEEELTEMIYHLVERTAAGLLASGFHTPNHRWVHTAALYCAYNTLREKDERYVRLAEKYLAEKIDIDENGEFAERSAGMYSAISDRALCLIAIEANKPELFELVKRNLLLVSRYIERDSAIFTQNSRRKDKGEVSSDTLFDFDRYTDICLMAYAVTHDITFLQILRTALKNCPNPARIYCTIAAFFRYPELKTLDISLFDLPDMDEDFHMFLPDTHIVRAKEKGVIYSVIAKNPSFLHVTVGGISISARMSSSFFAKAQFMPDEIEKIGEKKYRMRLHTWAEYKLPFDNPPEGSENYWSMDYKSRESISRCEYGYILDLEFTETGLMLHVKTEGMEKVPFKLEFIVTPGVYVRAGNAMTIATAGNFMCAADGDITLANYAGDRITVKGAFAEHFYHRDMRGSIPSPGNKYMLYLTSFSPVDKTVEIVCERNMPWDLF